MRDLQGSDAQAAVQLQAAADSEGLDLQAVDMNVTSQSSVNGAVGRILADRGRLDVVMHNAGHMVLSSAEAFTLKEYAEVYDIDVLGAQRVNRAALPHLRAQGTGLVIWVGSSSTRQRTHPLHRRHAGMQASVGDAYIAWVASTYRGGRPGQLDDVVALAAFLCSDAARHLSGTLLPIRPVTG